MTFTVICVLLGFFGASIQTAVDFDDQENWPGQCNTGMKQSPIDIMRPESKNYTWIMS